MKKYSLYIIAIPLVILIFIGFLLWQNRSKNVERYGVVFKNSTSGEMRFDYYDMGQKKVLDNWEGHPWFFALAKDAKDYNKIDYFFNKVKDNGGSVFKIIGTKEKDDCDYYADGVNDGACMEVIIVNQIEVL